MNTLIQTRRFDLTFALRVWGFGLAIAFGDPIDGIVFNLSIGPLHVEASTR